MLFHIGYSLFVGKGVPSLWYRRKSAVFTWSKNSNSTPSREHPYSSWGDHHKLVFAICSFSKYRPAFCRSLHDRRVLQYGETLFLWRRKHKTSVASENACKKVYRHWARTKHVLYQTFDLLIKSDVSAFTAKLTGSKEKSIFVLLITWKLE